MSKFNSVWLQTVHRVLDSTSIVKPRNKSTREILANQIVVDMTQPVLTLKKRALGYKFMCAEAAWIMGGLNTVKAISRYSKQISKFSNDGVYFNGAYGPKIIDQLSYVVDNIVKDIDTRQAVVNVWRENPRESYDVPCTLNLQWLVRKNKLHCIATMRSSDVWLGLVYDVPNFSFLSGMVTILLRKRDIYVELGDLYLRAGSQHLYEKDWAACEQIRNDSEPRSTVVAHPPIFDPMHFLLYDELIEYLWECANQAVPHGFLSEISAYAHTTAD